MPHTQKFGHSHFIFIDYLSLEKLLSFSIYLAKLICIAL